MAGRAAMRTPELPDSDEREDSPPRLARPKRTTRPPNDYAREQEIDTDRRKTRSQQKERIELGDRRDEATSDDAATEREELDVGGLVREIAKLRREIRLRDEIHKEEIQRTREQFGAALAEVRHELQSLTNRNTTPQCHSETCFQNNHDAILREIRSLREEVSVPAVAGSPTQMSRALRRPITLNNNRRPFFMAMSSPSPSVKHPYREGYRRIGDKTVVIQRSRGESTNPVPVQRSTIVTLTGSFDSIHRKESDSQRPCNHEQNRRSVAESQIISTTEFR